MRFFRTVSVAALLVAGTGMLLVPAHAATSSITFDNLNVPSGGRVTVNSQYSGQGVTFNDVSAIDYSPLGSGFAHSGTVAIEQCFAVEFCTSPVRASFTTGQRNVKVWVGFSSPLSQPLSVRLTAFDSGNASLGTADVTLPANGAPTPVTHPLAITAANGKIRSLEVSVPGGFTNGVVVDDVEFSDAGPAPVCSATSPPAVRVTQPTSGLVVQNNEFLLQGSVTTGGAPIQSASIIAFGNTTRTGTLYPTLIQATGGNFGPVRYNGILSAGGNKVIVTATNCQGTGAGPALDVSWTPIPASASFRLLGLEVTQGIQTPTNTVPLVAAAGSAAKRTFARLYFAVSGVQRIANVTGTVTASRPDGSAAAGPPQVSSLNSITVDSGATLTSARSALATSLNFELPREWLASGRLLLQVGHLEIEGAQSALPCQQCNNFWPPPGGGLAQPAFVTFHTVPPVRVWLVAVPYMAAGSQIDPRQLDFDMLASWLRRAYPSSDVRITQASMAPLASPPGSCDAVNTALRDWAAALPAQDFRTRYYGLVSDNGNNNFISGCSEIGGHFGSGPAGPSFPASDEPGKWDKDGSYADAYGGHEIAHMYGRNHPGFCYGQGRVDPNYPYGDGLLGNEVSDYQGLDAGDAALGLDLSLNDWRGGWHDVMTYCPFQWMSDYTYRGILGNLCVQDFLSCPDFAQFGVSRGAPPPRPSRKPAVAITGTLSLATGRVVLHPLWTQPWLTPTAAPQRAGEFAIEFRGAGGRLLARSPFQPILQGEQRGPRVTRALIDVVVPFPAGTQRIAVTRRSRTLASVVASAHAPTVRLISPNGGQVLGTRVAVRWRSSDRDGGRRWYTVLYSPDGKRFLPVAGSVTRTSLQVDLTRLPGGSRARFQVIASDGVRTGSDLSDRVFSVPVKPPRVSIAAPKNGAASGEGKRIAFVGTATDLQNGRLEALHLAWSSSLQGALGEGPSLTATLQPGTHVITLRATNKAGLSADASVTITVRANPPVVAASLSS